MIRAAEGKPPPPRAAAWGLLGLAVFAAGLGLLAADVPGWNAVWYLPAWYGYLLAVDAWIYRLQGHSFVSHRRRELAAILFWSVPFWFLFEAYNLVLQNWYYVFALRTDLLRGVLTFVAFATVLPACFVHAELVSALGWFKDRAGRPLRVGPGILQAFLVLGIASLVLPLLLPRLCFGLVWGATLWLPEVLNYRLGAPSLLRDLELGRRDRLAQLLVGGLWAGAVWEGFNYWARSKWIYTVPGFESWKLFEMPLAGFLGFPVLALSAFSGYSLLCHLLRGGRHWWWPDGQPAAPVPRARVWAAVLTAVLFSLATFLAIKDVSARSRRPLLGELAGLGPAAVAALETAGIPTPERLAGAVRRQGLALVAARTGIAAGPLAEAHGHALLALHKGMGTGAARLLRQAGIEGVADLAAADPEALARRLQELARADRHRPPRPAEVRVWVRAADRSGRPRR